MSNIASDAKTCFSSKVEYRAVIRYLYLKGKTGKEIHGKLADVYGSVKEWVNGKDPDFFSSGLMALEHRWSKCITL